MSLPVAELAPPAGMRADARRVFAHVARGLADRGDLFAEDVFTIAHYAECVAMAAASLKAGRRELLVRGYNGQDVANPLFGEARAWMTTARALASDLGLSPDARARWAKKRGGGRPKGATSAADREARRRQLTVVGA